jgi:hypothetical protein
MKVLGIFEWWMGCPARARTAPHQEGDLLMKRIAIALLIVSATLAIVQPAAAGQGSGDAPVSLRMVTSTTQADPGETVTVSGSGAVAGQVVVSLAPQADSAAGAIVTEETSAADDGTFSVTVTIPADVPDGIYAMRAEQFGPNGGVLHFYWNVFTVGAGGEGPFLPASGGEMQQEVSEYIIILGLLVIAVMLGSGLRATRRAALIPIQRD